MCALFPKKWSEKNHPKVERGIKNAAKATKKLALMIFSFAKRLSKKKEKRKREIEKFHLASTVQQGHWSLYACLSHRMVDFITRASSQTDFTKFLSRLFSPGYLITHETTKNYRQTHGNFYLSIMQ